MKRTFLEWFFTLTIVPFAVCHGLYKGAKRVYKSGINYFKRNRRYLKNALKTDEERKQERQEWLDAIFSNKRNDNE